MKTKETSADSFSPDNKNEELRLTDPWFMPSFTPTIELADGTVFDGRAALNSETDSLWIWLNEGPSLVEAFSVFSDSEKAKKIISRTTSIETLIWEGYTEIGLIKSINGQITIRLTRKSEL